jgi:fibronectin-binding autotransporter adhesin
METTRPFRSSTSLLALTLAAGLIPATGHAATHTWDGGGGSSSWGTGANWSPDNPDFNSTTDFIFGSSGANTYTGVGTVGGTRTINSLTYNDSYATSGGRVRFNSSGASGSGNANNLRFEGTGMGIYLTSGMTGSMDLGSGGSSVFGNMQLNGNMTITNDSPTGTLTISAPIIDQTSARNMTKNGVGLVTFTRANTYAGTTAVNNGILRINGTHTGGGTYTVGAAGTLQGTGSVSSTLDVSGTLSPGASVQSFASGTLNMLTGSTFEAELNSSVAISSGADLQVVNGDLNLTGTVTLTLGDLASLPAAFAPGSTLSLLNYSGAWNNGLFTFGTALADGDTFTAGLNTWLIDYDATTGGQNFNQDFVTGRFVNITAIPEPGATLLASLSLLALARRHR